MSGCCRLFLSGLLLASWFAVTAQTLDEATRDLARQVAGAAGTREPAAFSFRNVSSLNAGEVSGLRRNLENELRAAGVRLGERQPAAEVQVTISESLTRYLLVGDVRRGEDRQVVISSAVRQPAVEASTPPPSIVIEKKLVWAQEEPILDLALMPGPDSPGLLVLDRVHLSLYTQVNGEWKAQQSLPIPSVRPWPRDPRGRLVLNAAAYQAYLPGLLCRGATQPVLTLDCEESDQGWPLDSGTRLLGLASMAPGRNYFDGRMVTAPGGARQIPPFFSAASVEEQGNPLWIFAGMDGRTRLYNSVWEPVGFVEQWGSDIAGVDAPCASGRQILATRAGDPSEPDAVQAFVLVNREAVPASAPVGLPGPVTALWPSGRASVFVVSRAPSRYAAFNLSLSCGS